MYAFKTEMFPDYASLDKEKRRLPKGGPDRVRFCIWYSDGLDAKQDHEKALDYAHRLMFMMYCYSAQGILHQLGPYVGGIDVKFLGEGDD